MKVITLISGGDIGGAKTHVLSLLHGLGKTEQVRLVCFREGEFAEDARKLGIDTCVMEVSVGAAIGRLTQMIREEGFQIIHCHGARANLTGAILRRKVRVPIVTTVHSDYRLDYLGRPLHRLTYGTINTIALRMFDYHIGVSDAMAQLLISRGFDPQTMFAIYNGIDFTPVTPKLGREDYLRSVGLEVQDDTVVFGIAARLDPVKDMPTLIRGFSIAVKDHPNIRLLIAGEGEQRQMEGCLSVPGKRGVVARPAKVTVRALNRRGKPIEIVGEGFLAMALCHEIDHLDGVLYVDKIIEEVPEDAEE